MEEKDIVIVGGGPGGYAAAIRLSQLGRKATIIEQDAIGGTCLNRGCIPTRALVRGVEFIDMARSARDYGVNYQGVDVDLAKMMSRKDTVVKTIVSGLRMLLDGKGVEIINGAGSLLSPTRLEVKLADGTRQEISARRIIIATGSRSKKLTIPGGQGEKVINTTDALSLKEAPKSMLIMGGGFIGIAFASIYSKLGTKIIVVEPSARIFPEIDREIVAVLEKELQRDKIEVHTEAQVKSITAGESGNQNITVATKGEEVVLNAEYVLVADEREVNIDGLGLDKIGVKLNDRKGIVVNRKMETNVPNLFAVGDVTGEKMWTHVAYAEGIVAAENVAGKNSEIDYSAVPYWANTFPEVSGVGFTEEEAIAEGYQVKVGRFPFAASGMATIMGQRTGMIKTIVEEQYGQILGVHIVGPRATDLIAEAAMALKLEVTPEDIKALMHGHPTLSEAFWESVLDVRGQTIHFMSKNK